MHSRAWGALGAGAVSLTLLLTGCQAGGPLATLVSGTHAPAADDAVTPVDTGAPVPDPPTSGTGDDPDPVIDETAGPHDDPARAVLPSTTTTADGARTTRFDLGGLDLPRTDGGAEPYRTPVRGSLVTPADGTRNAPLIVLGHLRMPGCLGPGKELVEAHPCPDGTTEMRYDRGMEYLGQALARRGYAVLIPDLAPLYVERVEESYSQRAGFSALLGRIRTELETAGAGRPSALGVDLTGALDLGKVGFIGHSRSGAVPELLFDGGAHDALPIRSVLTYGAGLPVPDEPDGPWSAPLTATVPALSLLSLDDGDIDNAPALHAAAHLSQQRSAPHLLAVTAGLGHGYVNRSLSAAGIDDRTGCGPEAAPPCPGPAEHEDTLTTAALRWFDATLASPVTTPTAHRAAAAAFPLGGLDRLPSTLAGREVDWLVNPGADVVRTVLADAERPDMSALRVTGSGATLTRCRFQDRMDPNRRPDACPYPEAVTQAHPDLQHLAHLPAGGALEVNVGRPVDAFAVHLAPFTAGEAMGARLDLRAEAVLADGTTVALPMDDSARHALRNRAGARVTHSIVSSTVRLTLPERLRGAQVRTLRLVSDAGADVVVQQVDALRAAAGPAPGTTPGASPSAGSTTAPPKKPFPAK